MRRRPDLSGLQDGQDGFSTLQSDIAVEYAVMDNQVYSVMHFIEIIYWCISVLYQHLYPTISI